MRKALLRSISVVLIIGLSLICGLVYSKICEKLEYKAHPLEFSETVSKYSEKFGVPEIIVYSVIKTESNFQSNAVSSAGAVGLMQIMPTTCEWIAGKLGENYEFALMYDPDTNIRYGTYLISFLKLRYGNWDTVFAAYNAGLGRVDGWLENEEYSSGNGVLHTIPFKETREYIEKINDARAVYKRLYPELDN